MPWGWRRIKDTWDSQVSCLVQDRLETPWSCGTVKLMSRDSGTSDPNPAELRLRKQCSGVGRAEQWSQELLVQHSG